MRLKRTIKKRRKQKVREIKMFREDAMYRFRDLERLIERVLSSERT